MRLRPFAPLTVVGAGLLMVVLATHAASADAGQAPEAVQAASSGTGMTVSWQAPDGSSKPDHYGVLVTRGDGSTVTDRQVDGDALQTTLSSGVLGATTSARIVVSADYSGSRVDAEEVLVTLHPGPPAPDLAPALRVSGQTLVVRIPKTAPDGVTARTVRVLRDGAAWANVVVPAGRTGVTMTAPAGSSYAALYRNESAAGGSAFSVATVKLAVHEGDGPAAVTQLTATRTAAGLQVSWSPAVGGGDIVSYSVKVLQNGNRVGTSWTAASLTDVLVPVQNLAGPVTVTVKAKDADGATSTSTKTVDLGD